MTPIVSSSKTKPTSSRTWGGQLHRNSTLDIASNDACNKDCDKLTNAEKDKTKEAATELWKATLFISNSNQNKFDQLKKELHNNYISGDKHSYPNTFNNAYNRLNQHKTFGKTIQRASEGTAFTQRHKPSNKSSQKGSDSDSDNDTGELRKPPKRFADWTCAVCGEDGHPPSPNYCPMVRAIKTNKTLRSKLKASIENDSDNDSQQSNSKSRKKKTTPKGKDKKSEKNKQAELINQVTEKVLTQMRKYNQEQSSSESSQSDESAETNSELGMQFCQYEEVDDDASISSNSTSVQDQRSAFAQTTNTWTLVSKKSKRHKHASKLGIHNGDSITMKNNQTGVQRLFHCANRLSNNSFSSLHDNEDD